MRRSYLDLIPADVRREEAFYLTPEELVKYAATSPEVASALSSEEFCRDYYNRRMPVDLQLTEAPMGVPFCTVIRELPAILAQVATIQTVVMRWERCVVPRKEELNRSTNSVQYSQCIEWSTGRDRDPVIWMSATGDCYYVLSPWNSNDPYIRLELRKAREHGRGTVERVGEWRVPLTQLRPLLVALVVTRGHLFENTQGYDIALIRSAPYSRVQLEERELRRERTLIRRAGRELPFQDAYDE